MFHEFTRLPLVSTPENSVFSPSAGKYEPEKTLHLDTFHVVKDDLSLHRYPLIQL